MIETLLWLSAAVAAAPLLVVAGLCIAAALPVREVRVDASPKRPRIAVLMPAHDEESGISQALDSILAQLKPEDRMIVVADHCTDRTVALAREKGVEVLRRDEPLKNGKGYALDHGLQWLSQNPPQVVVVVDADCVAHPGSMERLVEAATVTGRPVQGTYLMEAPEGASRSYALPVLAFRIKNLVRPLGWKRLGQPCLLNGSGMAFPWETIRSVSLASSHIVEDKRHTVELALCGALPIFCPEALITSAFPISGRSLARQRRRWEHGHLEAALELGPRLLWAALRRGSIALLALAIELAVPPLSLPGLVSAGVFVASAGAAAVGAASWGPCLAVAGTWLLTAASVAFALERGGWSVPASTLLSSVWYTLGKVPVYAAFLTRREKRWIRTGRESSEEPPS